MLPLILGMVRIDTSEGSTTRDARAPQRRQLVNTLALFANPDFTLAVAGSVLFAIGMGTIYYHVVAVLIRAGYSSYSAGLVFGITWILSAIGSVGFGLAADRLGARTVLAATLLLCALGTFALVGASAPTIGSACVIAFVILWGSSANGVFQFTPVIFAERFGSQDLGALVGVQSAITGIVGAAAPIITGVLYDRFNDYRLAICLSAAATTAAFACIMKLSAAKESAATSDSRGIGPKRGYGY
jgi:MFS family permease